MGKTYVVRTSCTLLFQDKITEDKIRQTAEELNFDYESNKDEIIEYLRQEMFDKHLRDIIKSCSTSYDLEEFFNDIEYDIEEE